MALLEASLTISSRTFAYGASRQWTRWGVTFRASERIAATAPEHTIASTQNHRQVRPRMGVEGSFSEIRVFVVCCRSLRSAKRRNKITLMLTVREEDRRRGRGGGGRDREEVVGAERQMSLSAPHGRRCTPAVRTVFAAISPAGTEATWNFPLASCNSL